MTLFNPLCLNNNANNNGNANRNPVVYLLDGGAIASKTIS